MSFKYNAYKLKADKIIANLAKKHNKTVIAFAGCVSEDAEVCNNHGIDAILVSPGILLDVSGNGCGHYPCGETSVSMPAHPVAEDEGISSFILIGHDPDEVLIFMARPFLAECAVCNLHV